MKYLKGFALLLLLTVTACAGSRTVAGPSAEYVEIDNPAFTMSPNAPATILVPRRYVDSGLPQGGEILKMAYAKAGAVALPAAAPKLRIAVLPMTEGAPAAELQEQLRSASFAILGEPRAKGELSPTATAAERSAYVLNLSREQEFNAVVLVGVQQAGGTGTLIGELYDGMGGGVLLRRIETTVPLAREGAGDTGGQALSAAVAMLAEKLREGTRHIPWLCGVVAVDGEKIYLNAGRDSGITLGQRLQVYRGGKAVAGLGFDPGSRVATLEVAGFVGPDGSYGILREGAEVRISDVVGVD